MPTIRPRALVTAPVRGPGLSLLQELADLVIDPWVDHEPLRIYSAEQLAQRAADEQAQILVVEADHCAGPVFDLPLLAIASTRGEPTNVDVPAASAAGVPVLRAPGRNADAVAELTLALILACSRHVVQADTDVRTNEIYRRGTIPYQRFRTWQLAGRTAGIVGLGAVGRAIRWRLQGIGMQVITADPYNSQSTHDLQSLVQSADVVSIHVPATPETVGLIGPKQFEVMRDGAIFINTARAQVHDEDALVGSLRSGRLAAAGLDHFVGEQLRPGHPLLGMPNVVLTPHIGGATFDTEANHTSIIAEGLCRLMAGAIPDTCVNPEVLLDRR